MKELKIRLKGTAPLLMHSDRLSNPLDPMTVAHKKLTSKKSKTEDDQLEIAKSEFLASFYFDGETGIHLPTVNIRAAMVEGARMNKLGTSVQSGTVILADKVPLIFDGPKTPEACWASPAFVDARSVVVSKRRVMRYRPRFNRWAVEVAIIFDESILDAHQLVSSLENAGRYVGIGDYRPKKGGSFGRFEVEALS